MKIQNDQNIEQQNVEMEGAAGCRVRLLLGEKKGAPNFAMRQFEVAPGGHTPKHRHPYEHEIYVLEGAGVAVEGDVEHPIGPGDVLLVTPDEVHQFKNPGEGVLRFLCLIPNDAARKTVTVVPECGVEE